MKLPVRIRGSHHESGAAHVTVVMRHETIPHPRFMKDPLADKLRQIDQTSQVLMQEFLDHRQAAKAQHPDATDASIYEAWSIQKIAGLQHSVMHLADHLRQLQDRVSKM